MPTSTPRKSTTGIRKTAASRQDKPAAVALNFDTWSRDEAIEPYAIVIGGKRYESLDPMDMDYRELGRVISDDPDQIFEVLFPDHHKEILANKISVGAMVAFNQDVVVHFGLEDFIAAQG